MKLRIATRRSQLALVQTRWVAARVRASAPDVEIEEIHIVTKGDKIVDRPLQAVGGKALFVAEVEAALVDGRADLAVHSLKDVPGDVELAAGMDLVCIPEREDPRDVLVTTDGIELEALPAGAKVGTTSLRRVCQLSARRPDLAYATLRGNVETRLSRLDEGKFGAVVLAAAGLKRLGLFEARKLWAIPTEVCIPAIGQGTLALEARADDERVRSLLAPLEHGRSRIEAEAERAMLKRLEGNCYVPIAGLARVSEGGERLSLEGMVGSIDGTRQLSAASDRYLTGRTAGDHVAAARELGLEVAEGLLARGAADLIREALASFERSGKSGNGGGDRGPYKWG